MNSEISIAIAKRVRKIINERDLKHRAVAKACGYTPAKLCDLLNNRALIKPEDIVIFANYLDVTPNELYGVKQNTA